MQSPELDRPRFYFSLPRLIAKARGRSAERAEKNWLEANVVGTVVVLISYLMTARLLLSGTATWKQVALALPTLVVMWLAWLLLFYINSVLIRLLRSVGIMRQLSNARAQTLLIMVVTSAFAYQLLASATWTRILAAAWLASVALNLAAAMILALSARERADA